MNRKLVGLISIGLFLFSAAGCTSKQDGEQVVAPKWEDYQNRVERMLFELATAKEASKYAEQRQLDYATMVRVVIELAPDAALPEGFLVLEEGRYENEVQVWVPIDQLLKLSQQPQIQYIRTPKKPKPY